MKINMLYEIMNEMSNVHYLVIAYYVHYVRYPWYQIMYTVHILFQAVGTSRLSSVAEKLGEPLCPLYYTRK